MNISRENYEVYFIDYFDGILSAEQAAELMLFLETNPDLKDEFESFNAISVDVPEVQFPLRDSLKRGEINEQNFSWYAAAYVEGDLSSSEQLLFNNYINEHPHHAKDAELFRIAKLDAGNEVYPDKKSLKQPVPFVFNFNRTINYAVAAMLLLSLIGGGYFFYTKSLVQKSGGVAEMPVKNPTIPSSEIDTNGQKLIEEAPVEFGESVVAEKGQLAIIPQTNKKVKSVKSIEPEQPVAGNEKVEKAQPVITEQIVPQVAEVINEKLVAPEMLASNDKPVPVKKSVAPVNDDDEYVSVWEAIRNGAENNLRKAVAKEGEAPVADNSENKRIRILDVVSKGVEKISNDKVTVDAAYADNGKVSGFRLSAGKFSIEKN